MKLTIFRTLLVLAFAVAGFTAAHAQTEPMAGGYSNISNGSREARSAAAVAIRKHNSIHRRDNVRLVKIQKAEEQVVAGMNYRVCMVVKNNRGVRRTVTALIWQRPGRAMKATDWVAGCKEI
jgi:hypothetical protein